MPLTALKQPVIAELNQVDKLILSSLHSEIELVEQLGKHLIQTSGKRLRPLLVLLSAKACGYHGPEQITMATVIEFIHTATLLHDDVVDNASLRRGNPTVNSRWGNEAAVLVGDFLYSRSFQLMVELKNLTILQIIANATNTIAEGEVLQLLHQHNPETSEQKYLHVIRSKTAKLFEAAAEVGAVLANSPSHIQYALAQYGLHLGTAYQLIDDVLDYQANAQEFGKQLGNDLAEGKPTMPLIYLYHHGSAEQKSLIIEAISTPQAARFEAIQAAIQQSGALDYTLEFARREAVLARQALTELPVSEYKQAALDLTDFIITRGY